MPRGYDSVRNAAYDPVGDVLQRVDGRGVVTNYMYNDPENKLTNISYNVSSATGVPAQPSVALSYDGFGRLATLDNGVKQTDYGFTSGGSSCTGYGDDDNPLNVQIAFYQGGSIACSMRQHAKQDAIRQIDTGQPTPYTQSLDTMFSLLGAYLVSALRPSGHTHSNESPKHVDRLGTCVL